MTTENGNRMSKQVTEENFVSLDYFKKASNIVGNVFRHFGYELPF